jgi:hypothetical protein
MLESSILDFRKYGFEGQKAASSARKAAPSRFDTGQ